MAASRFDITPIEGASDVSERNSTIGPYFFDQRQMVSANPSAMAFSVILPRPSDGAGVGLPKRVPRALAGSQRSPGSLADDLSLMLCERRRDMQRQQIGLWYAHSNEAHATFHKVGDERDIAGETVQFGSYSGHAGRNDTLRQREGKQATILTKPPRLSSWK